MEGDAAAVAFESGSYGSFDTCKKQIVIYIDFYRGDAEVILFINVTFSASQRLRGRL
jgi:hypothetical protein